MSYDATPELTDDNAVVGPKVRFKEPLVTHIYTADPSAHVFEGRIYVYPSHDRETDIDATTDGAHFDMRDYHVLSLADFDAEVIDHGEILNVSQVRWAERQMWAPDAARKGDKYYFYFPAKDYDGRFRIGVAVAPTPVGPFTAQLEPIPHSYSIDPAVFVDDDGQAYMVFGGLWGGQLENWQSGDFDPDAEAPTKGPALCPRVAKLRADMLGFEAPSRAAQILDPRGQPLLASDTERRFFEGPWMHKYGGRYYLSYSTGDTHLLVYATSDSPLGPFTYGGTLMTPPVGWTTHHSIIEFRGKWYLFYHDSTLSGGDTARRCVKVQELTHADDGSIPTLSP